MRDERCVCLTSPRLADQCARLGRCAVAPVERGEPDKVREALAYLLSRARIKDFSPLADALGVAAFEKDVCDALLALRAAPNEGEARSIFCVWCGAYVEYHGKPGEEIAAKSAVREHSATCPEHPAVKELAALRAAPSGEAELVGWVALDASGERVADELYASQDVALREWPKANAVPVFRAAPQDGPQVTEAMVDDALNAAVVMSGGVFDRYDRAIAAEHLTNALTPQPNGGNK